MRSTHQLQSATNCLDWSGKVRMAIGWSSTGSHQAIVEADLTVEGGQRDATIPTGFKVSIGGEDRWEYRWSVPENSGNFSYSGHWERYYHPINPNLREAYVSAGNNTFIRAGRMTESVGNTADDQPFGLLEPYNSAEVDSGVGWERPEDRPMAAVQGMIDLENGVTVGAALEETQDNPVPVGVINYRSDVITAHVSAYGVGRPLYSGSTKYAPSPSYHAGATIDLGNARLRAATAFDGHEEYGTIVAGELMISKLTMNLAIDQAVDTADLHPVHWSFAAGASYQISPHITASAAYREYRIEDQDDRLEQVVGEMEYTATETVTAKIGGGVRTYRHSSGSDSVSYMHGSLLWEPGGGFRSEVSGEVNSEGAYKTTFEIEKAFE